MRQPKGCRIEISGRFKFTSIASARVDQHVLSRRVSVIAIALRQIIAGTRGGLGTSDGADRAAGDRAGDRATRSSGDETAQQATDNGATDRTCGGVRRRRRRWRRRISDRWRRRITGSDRRRSIRAAVILYDL